MKVEGSRGEDAMNDERAVVDLGKERGAGDGKKKG